MKIYQHLIASFLIILLSAPFAVAAEQDEEDVYATVVVNPIFKLSVENSHISFGFLKPGESVEVAQGTSYNHVTCTSNKGNKWYLKLQVTSDIMGPQPPIKPGDFKWKVFRTGGDGVAVDGWQPFTEEPSVAYTSGVNDTLGDVVKVYFQYRLDLPQTAIAGIYSANILYTMTDIL
ncbi:hypothetical protein ACFL3N_01635 [Candidatus Omnitrophota bacterium]